MSNPYSALLDKLVDYWDIRDDLAFKRLSNERLTQTEDTLLDVLNIILNECTVDPSPMDPKVLELVNKLNEKQYSLWDLPRNKWTNPLEGMDFSDELEETPEEYEERQRKLKERQKPFVNGLKARKEKWRKY